MWLDRNDVVDILLSLMLTPYGHVTHFSVGDTQDFVHTVVTSHGTSREFRQLHHEDQTLNTAKAQLLQPGSIVFTFLDSSHYTTVIVNNREKCINYMDSINTRPRKRPWEVNMITELYKDEASQLGRDIDIHLWPVHYPTVGMVPQIAYV